MSVFGYPPLPHQRRHGPAGYTAYERYRPWLRDEFSFRCVFCLRREQWETRFGRFHMEHFLPQSSFPHAVADYDSLLYSCVSCNIAKSDTELPDPCHCMLAGTVEVHDDGSIHGLTRNARRIIRVLGLDAPEYQEYRRLWIGVEQLARAENPSLFRQVMKYPDDLPNLAILRPPNNLRPEGVEQSHFARRARGELPETY